MKKRLLIALICILSALGVFGLVAACGTEQLGKPANVRIGTDDGSPVLIWSEVSGARTYVVEIDGVSKQTRRTEMELASFDLENGTYTVRIKACGADYKDSAWATTTYTKSESTGLVYKELVAGEYTVVAIGGASGNIKIEDEFNGLPITTVGTGAFAGSSNITSIEIGKNVRTIESRAFSNCSFLSDVIFDEDSALTIIGDGAFQSCLALTRIDLPDTVTYMGPNVFAYCRSLSSIELTDELMVIANSAFDSCESLEQIVISENVVSIGSRAFAECTSLKRVEINSKRAVVDDGAFLRCGNKISEDNPLTDENKLVFDLGNGITSIGKSAFMGISAMDSIAIPDSVTTIGNGAFTNCTNLANVSLGTGLTSVGLAAFNYTKIWYDADNYVIVDRWLVDRKNVHDANGDLRALDIVGIADAVFSDGTLTSAYQLPNSLVYIGNYAFENCQMASVTIGNSVKIIGSQAFAYCPNLRTVVLGNNVEVIEGYAFAMCDQLTATSSTGNKNVNIPRSVKRVGMGTFYGTALWVNSTDMLVVDNWVVGCREEANGKLEVPSGTVGIADYAFVGCKKVSGVYMPSTVEYIGEGAFYECEGLRSVDIPAKVKEIKQATFYSCNVLTMVTIPSGVDTIESYAFRSCPMLGSLNIPDSVTTIGEAAFSFCDMLREVTIGNSVEGIGEYAFAYCVSLEKIKLPDSLMEVSDYTFYRCSALSEVDFGSGVRSIGSHAFYQCTMLSELDMPDNITSIGDYAFYKCKAMWKLKIGENVSSVGEYAFYECYSLRKVVIPDAVECVGDCAFMNCSDLKSVTLGVNLTTLGKHVFMNDRHLTIYAESSQAYSTWDKLWNSQFRPVLWGCELTEDKSYVESITLGENTISNGNAQYGTDAPTRLGWTFVGWATQPNGDAAYTAADIVKAPNGTTLYSVWEHTETKPEILVTPDYEPGWDKKDNLFGGMGGLGA